MCRDFQILRDPLIVGLSNLSYILYVLDKFVKHYKANSIVGYLRCLRMVIEKTKHPIRLMRHRLKFIWLRLGPFISA